MHPPNQSHDNGTFRFDLLPADPLTAAQHDHTGGTSSPHRLPHETSSNLAQQAPRTSSHEVPGRPPEPTDDAPDDDAYVQTLHRMSAGQQPTELSPQPCSTNGVQGSHVIEYFGNLSSISVLAEALGHRQEKRLIQIDLPASHNPSAENKEIAGLDEADIAYLNTRRVFNLPSRELWYEFYIWLIDQAN